LSHNHDIPFKTITPLFDALIPWNPPNLVEALSLPKGFTSLSLPRSQPPLHGVLGMEKIEEDKETLKLRMKKMEKEEIFL